MKGAPTGGPAAWLRERAIDARDRVALSLPDRELSWRALHAEAGGFAAGLAEAGVRSGDVVATLLGSADFACRVHALWRLGAIVLPLNLRLSADELAFQVRDSGATWLVHGEAELASRAGGISRACPGVRPLRPRPGQGAPGPGDAPVATADRAVAILYTSGTTGSPKGATLTAANFEASAVAARKLLGGSQRDRSLACMPLFHVGGLSLLTRSLLAGSSVEVHEGFDPDAVAAALQEDRVTDVSLVANMLARVLEAGGDAKPASSLRRVLVGGGPVPDPLLARAHRHGFPVAPTYGLTEATSQVATRAPGDDRAIGLRPLPGVELRIDDASGPGDEGEVLVRGPTVMAGYWRRSSETARALRGGWLHTGDMGKLHPDGTLTVLDRRSDLIVSGGENVYPAEIESVLLAHHEVVEAAVGRRDDAAFGARPVAFVATRPGAGDDVVAGLERWCRERLASFKVPVAFHRVSELPRTAAGKLRRSQLVEPGRPD